MSKKFTSSLLVLYSFILSPMYSYGEAVVKIPAKINATPGRIIVITAETTNKEVRWHCYSKDADLIAIQGTKTVHFASNKPGIYLIVCWTAEGDVPSNLAECLVTIDPPIPPDPLRELLKEAYSNDTNSGKDEARKTLILIYKKALITTVPDKSIITAEQLLTILHNTAQTLLNDNISAIRRILANEFNTKFPSEPKLILNEEIRKTISKEFLRIIKLLEEL